MTDFMTQQVRFASLKRVKPDAAQALFDKTTADARRKFVRYARISGDLDKFLAKEAKAKGEELVTVETVKSERPKREKDPEAEARRAARRAERAAKRELK